MTSAIKPKHQRLVLLVIALVALVGAGLLAAWALRNQASYFYLPSEIVEQAPAPDEDLRLGGMVEPGSIQPQPDGVTIRFAVGDGTTTVPVSFTGIAPALFQENSGVVAEGYMGQDGTFVATNLLAKHDENYMPRELEGMSREQARQRIEATLE
ncbi:cytochrome c maturation protein CcmE [Alteraurantiacibacter buctensis]|uniref:Cytochrome c-type biogenesis protein CcmE n=1 Tax=Alteraurantiacibacter buctensis TaxID=1503981 RepID=A0A844Z1Z7_9SPHN|nr:cytochrome c maturation protein CcmE [Alteraurantiacibacter buctensis]MXO72487.1 cytochrome c maturation protein CcmE [Alteraurantiacibacter buctensis]